MNPNTQDLSEDEQEHETEVEEDPESETSNNDCTPAPVPAAPAEGVEEANVASGPSRDKLVRVSYALVCSVLYFSELSGWDV